MRSNRKPARVALLVAILLSVVAPLLVVTPAIAQSSVSITEWQIPTSDAGSLGVAVASSGAVFFTEASKVGMLLPQSNTFTEWQLPSGSDPVAIAIAPDGQVYLSEGVNAIGRFDPGSGTYTRWDVSLAAGSRSIFDIALDLSAPSRILVWVSMGGDLIGTLDPSTNTFKTFKAHAHAPRAIAVDANGIVWVGSEFPLIMRLDPSSAELRTYLNWPYPVFNPPPSGPVPSSGTFEGGMRVDLQGRLLFTEPSANKFGRLDPAASTITEFAVPTADSAPFGLALGATVAFTERAGNKIGTLDLASATGVSTVITPLVTTAPTAQATLTASSSTLTSTTSTVTPTVTAVTGAASGGFEEFPIPTGVSEPRGMAAAIGGKFFYVESRQLNPITGVVSGGNKIGLIKINNPPVADAGPGQTVSPGIVAVLDATSSFDPDGDPLTYSWVQTAGPMVTLVDASTPTPSFTAPPAATQTTLTFQLTVSDGVYSRSAAVNVIDSPFTTFSFGSVIGLSPNILSSVGTQPTVAASGSNVYVVWNYSCLTCTTSTVSFTRSTDSGATFGPVITLSPPPGACTALPCGAGAGNSAPVVAASGNQVYVAWADRYHGTFFAGSADGGATFSPPVNVVSMGFLQANLVQIAASGSFIYLLSSCMNCGPNVGQGYGQLLFSMSADFGQTFSTTTLSSTYGGCCGQLAVSLNDVYTVWNEVVSAPSAASVVKFASSTNNGATLSTPIVLSNPSDNSTFPQMALAGSYVYMAWHDSTIGAVMFTSSANGGVTFGSTSSLLPGVIGGAAIPGLAAYGNNVYVSSAPRLASGTSISFTTSNDHGNSFAPQQVLNNSPLFPASSRFPYPQIAATGSSAYIVWSSVPLSSSNDDIAFVYSTSNGATFGGPVNLSNNPENSELTFGAGSTPLGRVDETAVSAGRVHIVWQDFVVSPSVSVVKYVSGALVPAAFSVSSSGAASTSVTRDPSGDTVVSQTDSGNKLLATVTLPPGSSAPSGAMTLTYSTVGANSIVQISGVTVPYPPGKSATMLVDPSATTICINDRASGASLTAASCGSTNTAISQVMMPCDGTSRTFPQAGQPPFPEAPSNRTYTCTLLPGSGGTSEYMKVDGLAYSNLESCHLTPRKRGDKHGRVPLACVRTGKPHGGGRSGSHKDRIPSSGR